MVTSNVGTPSRIRKRRAAGYVEDLTRRGTIDPYFDQPIYDVYAKSAARVNRDWDNLPFYSQLDAEFTRLIIPTLRPGGHSATSYPNGRHASSATPHPKASQ